MSHSSILHSEITSQPETLQRLLDQEAAPVARLGQALARRPFKYVLIAARGTSDNAARYGQYLFGALQGMPVALAAPSLLTMYQAPLRLADALVVGISQSGQSPDIVTVVAEARRQGAPTIAITNEPASPLAQAADHVIALHVGAEQGVAATKTYTAQLAAMALLATSLAGLPEHTAQLYETPHLAAEALKAEAAAQEAAAGLAPASRAVVIGRGFNYATAFELALKIKELTYVEAEPYSPADFKHGPIAMVGQGFPALLVSAGPVFRPEMDTLAALLAQRKAHLVMLGEQAAPETTWVPIPAGMPEWLSPIAAIIPGQLLAYHLSLARGYDPDRPRFIQKVTLTR